ncbi:MAG: hypothetical protein R2788_11090 [Saprospiraceae bacterium]
MQGCRRHPSAGVVRPTDPTEEVEVAMPDPDDHDAIDDCITEVALIWHGATGNST